MMLAIMAPLLRDIDTGSPTGTSLVLGLAVAANLGGMASLIGTPANAIAVGALAQVPGLPAVSFLDWLLIGLPPGLLLLCLAGWMLRRRLAPDTPPLNANVLRADSAAVKAPRWQVLIMAATLLVTVGLWLSSGLHGIPPAAVSFLPIVLLTASGVLGAQDLRGLNYDVLFLLAGGLALGEVVVSTGLSGWLVSLLPFENFGKFGAILLLALVTVLLSNLMSNTAAANILIPLGVALATGFEPQIAIPIALSASAAMCLPISTPPNAMVYASGRCKARDFLLLGGVIGIIAPLLVTLWSLLVVGWLL
jgi:sodium-dependent dicarboxylate transporter 2/3/5